MPTTFRVADIGDMTPLATRTRTAGLYAKILEQVYALPEGKALVPEGPISRYFRYYLRKAASKAGRPVLFFQTADGKLAVGRPGQPQASTSPAEPVKSNGKRKKGAA